MATARRSRTLATDPQRLWKVIKDPHHIPRWWPGVRRVEGVEKDRWTQVFMTKKGRPVRADFRLLSSEPPELRDQAAGRVCWIQEVAGTPFERVLNESITEILLEPVDAGTLITIAQHQKLRGYSRTGAFLLRRATRTKLDEALDGLERICG